MEGCITRAEHEEFALRMSEEHKRQNRRIENLEETTRQISALTVSVEKMACSMESMLSEQKAQGTRLEKLESAPGDRWEKLVQAVITALASGGIGYLAGMWLH